MILSHRRRRFSPAGLVLRIYIYIQILKMKMQAYMVCSFTVVVMSLLAAAAAVNGSGSEEVVNYARNLLINTTTTEDYGGGDDGGASPDRIGTSGGLECSKDNIFIDQGPSAPLPNGIPTYSVNIGNVCVGDGCSISDIHVTCGSYSSARLVDPIIFRRLSINDCLVNDGKPLSPGDSVSFQYADSFPYKMAVSSISCSS